MEICNPTYGTIRVVFRTGIVLFRIHGFNSLSERRKVFSRLSNKKTNKIQYLPNIKILSITFLCFKKKMKTYLNFIFENTYILEKCHHTMVTIIVA